MSDDHHQPKQTITDIVIKFEPWLVAFGAILSTVATFIAAGSAYFSWQQIEAAKAAVNLASRNQAFSEFLLAKEALCEISLTQNDQWDGTIRGFEPPKIGEPTLLVVNYDELTLLNDPTKIEQFDKDARIAIANLRKKFRQLEIWLSPEQVPGFEKMLSNVGYSATALQTSKLPAEVSAIATQWQCRRHLDVALSMYKGIVNDDTAWGMDGVIILPASEKRPIGDIIREWTEDYALETTFKYLEYQGLKMNKSWFNQGDDSP